MQLLTADNLCSPTSDSESVTEITRCVNKMMPLYFKDNHWKNSFTDEFMNELLRKPALNLSPPLKSLGTLPGKIYPLLTLTVFNFKTVPALYV